MPSGWVLCHGDLHQRNVVQTSGGPVLLDWDMLCAGPPGWDHAPLIAMVRHWGVDRAVYDRYAEGYGSDRRDEPVTASLAVLRAVAATLMRVVAEGPEPRSRRRGVTSPPVLARRPRRPHLDVRVTGGRKAGHRNHMMITFTSLVM